MFHIDGGNTAMDRSFDTERDGLEGELGPRPRGGIMMALTGNTRFTEDQQAGNARWRRGN